MRTERQTNSLITYQSKWGLYSYLMSPVTMKRTERDSFHAKRPIILPDFNQIWIFSADLNKIPQYINRQKSTHWKPWWFVSTDRHTFGGRTWGRYVGNFRNYATAFNITAHNFLSTRTSTFVTQVVRFTAWEIGSTILVCTRCPFHNFIANLPIFMSTNLRLFFFIVAPCISKIH